MKDNSHENLFLLNKENFYKNINNKDIKNKNLKYSYIFD